MSYSESCDFQALPYRDRYRFLFVLNARLFKMINKTKTQNIIKLTIGHSNGNGQGHAWKSKLSLLEKIPRLILEKLSAMHRYYIIVELSWNTQHTYIRRDNNFLKNSTETNFVPSFLFQLYILFALSLSFKFQLNNPICCLHKQASYYKRTYVYVSVVCVWMCVRKFYRELIIKN